MRLKNSTIELEPGRQKTCKKTKILFKFEVDDHLGSGGYVTMWQRKVKNILDVW